MPKRLSLLAGAGRLVPAVLAAARGAGYDVQVLSLAPRQGLDGFPVIPLDIGQPAAIIEAIREFGTTQIVMVGALELSDAHREGLARFATGSQAAGSAGDTAISKLAGTLEAMTGAKIVGVHEMLPELLATEGLIAGPALDEADIEAADFALLRAREVGRLDLGQAIVVAGHRVVAVEDVGGTDALLKRVGEHRAAGRVGGGSSRLMLAKAAKPDQPLIVDLPAVGPGTVAAATAAGVSVIALEAGKTIVIDGPELVAAADAAGISVVGRAIPNG